MNIVGWAIPKSRKWCCVQLRNVGCRGAIGYVEGQGEIAHAILEIPLIQDLVFRPVVVRAWGRGAANLAGLVAHVGRCGPMLPGPPGTIEHEGRAMPIVGAVTVGFDDRTLVPVDLEAVHSRPDGCPRWHDAAGEAEDHEEDHVGE